MALFPMNVNGGSAAPTLEAEYTQSGGNAISRTISNAIKIGIVVIASTNNTSDSSYYEQTIDSLSAGSYEKIDDTYYYADSMGVKTTTYIIKNVPSGATISIKARYVGVIQIIKII